MGAGAGRSLVPGQLATSSTNGRLRDLAPNKYPFFSGHSTRLLAWRLPYPPNKGKRWPRGLRGCVVARLDPKVSHFLVLDMEPTFTGYLRSSSPNHTRARSIPARCYLGRLGLARALHACPEASALYLPTVGCLLRFRVDDDVDGLSSRRVSGCSV